MARKLPIAAAALLAALLLAPAAGAAAPGSGLLLTVAARYCPDYTDITANRARNNIMESLRDLGPDSPYGAGELVSASVEDEVQPKCKPLVDWRFTLGTGHQTRAVEGHWGALSIVTGAFGTDLTTEPSVPLRDSAGLATGSSLAGATTITLSDAQAKLAAASSSLWIQGGTPADPILDKAFPNQYGFGALRCATDNYNGDNVEWIGYPSGIHHVFCFAYYVKPPPTSGTIVVRKLAEGAPAGAAPESFGFAGNVSFNPGGLFELRPPPGGADEEEFFRAATGAGEAPWTVRELGVPSWRLRDLSCGSASGDSEAATDLGSGDARIRLAAGDVVTCTYVDAYSPPPQGLEIRKVSHGGLGDFDYTVTPLDDEGPAHHARATTVEEGLAALAAPSLEDLAPGRYRIAEDSPRSEGGSWTSRAIECDGRAEPAGQPPTVTVAPGAARVCTFTNDFVPHGSITLAKVTRGGVGTAHFAIIGEDSAEAPLEQRATTHREGEPATAHGDDSSRLPLGRYAIVDLGPAARAGGGWTLAAVVCDGRPLPFAAGRVMVTLSAADPHLHCTFTNLLEAERHPPQPPPEQPGAAADLVVTKEALEPALTLGEAVGYRIVVVNSGRSVARGVELVDAPRGARVLAARSSRGHCERARPIVCPVGQLRHGQRAVVRIALRPERLGRYLNYAAAGTPSSGQVRDASGVAGVRVRRPPPLGIPGLG